MVPVKRHGEDAGHALAAGAVVVDRRRHRSRLPAVFTIAGLLVGAIVADVVILSALADSVIVGVHLEGGWSEPAAWWGAIRALSDPTIALASVALGGVPGAIAGRALAVRRLRSDRVDALLPYGSGPYHGVE